MCSYSRLSIEASGKLYGIVVPGTHLREDGSQNQSAHCGEEKYSVSVGNRATFPQSLN
jgi:hypothetical protein